MPHSAIGSIKYGDICEYKIMPYTLYKIFTILSSLLLLLLPKLDRVCLLFWESLIRSLQPLVVEERVLGHRRLHGAVLGAKF